MTFKPLDVVMALFFITVGVAVGLVFINTPPQHPVVQASENLPTGVDRFIDGNYICYTVKSFPSVSDWRGISCLEYK